MDARKPQRKTQYKAERDARKFAQIVELLMPFADVDTLADFYQRGEQPSAPDGYPASSGGESSIGFSRGVSDPTLRTVIQLERDGTWQLPHDRLLERIIEFQSEVSEIHGVAKSLHKCHTVVVLAGSRLRGRQSALQGDCLSCQRSISGVGSDKMRSGLCHSCSNKFYKERKPEQSVTDWLGAAHPLANRRPAPPASRDEVPVGVTYCA